MKYHLGRRPYVGVKIDGKRKLLLKPMSQENLIILLIQSTLGVVHKTLPSTDSRAMLVLLEALLLPRRVCRRVTRFRPEDYGIFRAIIYSNICSPVLVLRSEDMLFKTLRALSIDKLLDNQFSECLGRLSHGVGGMGSIRFILYGPTFPILVHSDLDFSLQSVYPSR